MTEAIGDWTVRRYLDELASAAPAPGGGAVAALHAAQAAALVRMVCNLTIGRERFAAAEPTMRRALQAAAALQDLCGQILDGANPNVASDVGVAAASAAAAIDTAALNVEINLATLADPPFVEATARELDTHRAAASSAAAIVAQVRNRITA